jgi:hypothetical protein
MDIWAKIAWGYVAAWAAMIVAAHDTASDASQLTLYNLNGLMLIATAIFIGVWFFTQAEK